MQVAPLGVPKGPDSLRRYPDMGNGIGSSLRRPILPRATRSLEVVGAVLLLAAVGLLIIWHQSSQQSLAKETAAPVSAVRSVGHWYDLPGAGDTGRVKVVDITSEPVTGGHGSFNASIELCAGSRELKEIGSNYVFQAVDGGGINGPAPLVSGLPASDSIQAGKCVQFQDLFSTTASWNPTTLEGVFSPGDGYRWLLTSR